MSVQQGLMQGLIVDYCGVIDANEEGQRHWRRLFEDLGAKGIGVVVLAPEEEQSFLQEIRERQLAIVNPVKVVEDRPNPVDWKKAANDLGVLPSRCVLVDDSILAVRAAVDNGLVGVFYQHTERAVTEVAGFFGIEREVT